MADSGTSLTEASKQSKLRTKCYRAVFVVLGVCVLTSGIYFARRSGANAEVYSNDFNVYYYAAREIVAGHDPYQRSLGEWTPYLYPPFLAELIVPLALLPLPVAAYLWFLINAASIAAAAWMAAALASEPKQRDLSPLRHQILRPALTACAVIIVLRFVLDNFNLGQVNPLVAALAVAHVYLYARGRRALSAVALVVAISIKLTPALLLVYHVSRLRLKYSAACVALLAGLTIVSFLPFGAAATEACRTFVDRTIKNEQGYELGDVGNQSLRGVVARIAAHLNKTEPDQGESHNPTTGLTLLLSAGLLVVSILSASRARDELPAVAPLFCCMVLLSPLSWKAHFVMLIPPLAYLFAVMRSSAKARRLLIAAALVVTLLLFNVPSPRIIGLAAAEWADAHSFVFTGALLIFIASVASTLTRKFGNHPRVC